MTVGAGWAGIVATLETELRRLDPHGCWCQKPYEKYGTLRGDWTASNPSLYPAVEAALDRAEERSKTVCETCGGVGTLTTLPSGWLKTLCGACADRRRPLDEALTVISAGVDLSAPVPEDPIAVYDVMREAANRLVAVYAQQVMVGGIADPAIGKIRALRAEVDAVPWNDTAEQKKMTAELVRRYGSYK